MAHGICVMGSIFQMEGQWLFSLLVAEFKWKTKGFLAEVAEFKWKTKGFLATVAELK